MKYEPLVLGSLLLALCTGASERRPPAKPPSLTRAEDALNQELKKLEKEYLTRKIKAYELHRDGLEKVRKQLLERGNLEDAVAVEEARKEASREIEDCRAQLAGGSPRRPAQIAVTGDAFEIAPLRNGERAFSNRGYIWAGVPKTLEGWSFTRPGGHGNARIRVEVKKAGQIIIAVQEDSKLPDGKLWRRVSEEGFSFNSPVKTAVILLERTVSAGETVEIPRDPGFTGTMLLLPP